MDDQHQVTDESFDDLARKAGAALRRPAPADGARSVRAARRRQQQTRAAVGGVTLAAIIAVGAVVLRDDPSSTTIVVQPDDTTVDTTDDAVPNSTVPNTDATPTSEPAVTAPVTVPPSAPVTTRLEPVAGLSDDAIAWRDARIADGYTSVDIVRGQGTTARLLTAQRPDPQAFESAVLLDDGRVIELPDGFAAPGASELHAVGGKPALLDIGADLANAMAVWQLDPASGEWTSSGDLGLGVLDWDATPTIRPYTVTVVGERMLVGINSFVDGGDGTQVPAPDRRGIVVQPDLTVTSIATPPEGVPMFWSTAAAGKALQIFGPNLGSIGTTPYEQPWAYDPVADTWSEISLPNWFDCAAPGPFECQWITIFDGGITLELVTDRGVLVGVPDDSLGLYDPDTNTWTRVDAPFVGQGWWSAVDLGDRVVLAPGRSFQGDFGTIGVLDLASGIWTAAEVDIPAAIQQRIDTEWFDVAWDLRSTGTRVLAVPGPANGASDEDPITVYDVATGEWWTPTPSDLASWDLLATNLERATR